MTPSPFKILRVYIYLYIYIIYIDNRNYFYPLGVGITHRFVHRTHIFPYLIVLCHKPCLSPYNPSCFIKYFVIAFSQISLGLPLFVMTCVSVSHIFSTDISSFNRCRWPHQLNCIFSTRCAIDWIFISCLKSLFLIQSLLVAPCTLRKYLISVDFILLFCCLLFFRN